MRDVWQSRWGFILAAAGSAIGLGNLWRFPFQAYKNGGGAFLLPYFVALFTAAIPVMIMELTYGRSARGGSVRAFARLRPKLEYVGWTQVMIPVANMTYYAAIMAVALVFMVYSLVHGLGLIHWLADPGKLMMSVAGAAAHGLDWRAGVAFLAFPTAIATVTDNVALQGLLGFLFFFSLFIGGLTSGISMLESFVASALDKFSITRERLVAIVSGVGLLGSGVFATYAGFNYLLDVVDEYVGNVALAAVALVEVVLIGYLYGTARLRQEANAFSFVRIGPWWDGLLKYFTPVLLGAVVVTNFLNVFTDVLSGDTVKIVSNLAFGWGAVAIMAAGAAWLYGRPGPGGGVGAVAGSGRS